MKKIKARHTTITTVYEGLDLGCTYTPNKSTIKVWAPTASRIICHLQREAEFYLPMEKDTNGVWTVELMGDYELYSYVYHVYFAEKMNIAIDPYAVASTPNHERTVIVDLEKTRIDSYKSALPPLESYTDSIIYEVHVRDFSIDPSSGMKYKGKYLAFTEEGTKTPNGYPTGIDYIKSLGVTHLQLLPVYDYGSVNELDPDSSYNWGYDPVQYNVPEGSYSTDVQNPYSRILELKHCIQFLHKQGLRVIMDVVYNHMFDKDASAFEKIVPGYYFRQNDLGEISNGSFCGNDLDSTQFMTQHYLLQSTRWWIEEYGFDGFRFDLMGILDVDTMNRISQQTRSLDPSAMIYGEGWNMPTFLENFQKATMMNHMKMPLIAYFNDLFREKIKGGTLEDKFKEGGYGAGDMTKSLDALSLLRATVTGVLTQSAFPTVEDVPTSIPAYFDEPQQSINYVECHDNHTLWDKMQLSLSHESEELRKKRQIFMTGMILLSQGIPFIHAGQEFLRTKELDHNSYKSPDSINRIDWTRKEHYQDVVEQVCNFIRLRKLFKELRLKTTKEILEQTQVILLEHHVILYILKSADSVNYKQLMLVFNPNSESITVAAGVIEGDFDVIFTPKGFSEFFEKECQTDFNRHEFRALKNQEIVLEPLGIYCLRQ
jgi:pullulanase